MFKPVNPNTNFPEMERDLLKRWYETGIVKKYLEKNAESKEKFSFLDGPITANNPMGVHHAWGRTYKDLWQRFWNMQGNRQRFQNGFDEQGLWVEVEVEKELGLKSKKEIENLVPGDKFKSLEKFINLCKERVKKFSTIQTEQSKRLGYFMDWDNSYHTSSAENNYAIWNYLKTVHEKGWLYKGRDSVPWCPRCGTAISQHEILTEEYKLLTHKTIVFKLPLKERHTEYFLAWTTTPWTIPGNVALAVDPNLSYWKMSNDKGEKIILINPTQSGDFNKEEMLVNKPGLTDGWTKIEELKGSDLIGIEYTAPFDNLPAVTESLKDYTHRVIAADPRILEISPLEGTGIVHIAPGAGAEDFQLSKKEKLPVIPEIDETGIFIKGFDFLSGLYVKDASKAALEYLEKENFAFKVLDYTHRYPTCWRCKTELVWRVVDEWYIGMDMPSNIEQRTKNQEQKKTYREVMIEVAEKINWIPKFGLDRELDWLNNMHDWLISKKRYWGLALPIWECQKCGNFDVIGSKEELKEKAVEGWENFEGHTPHRPWIDGVRIKCSKCTEIVSRVSDVGNPWLDAGIVPFSTMPKEWFPADFITESFPGQFKNWFYSLIAMSTALSGSNPFKTVLGFATVKDEKGEEMHKSKGNAIEFNEAADKIGVDVMRWMYLRTNPEHNVLFGYKVADEIRRMFHLRLWNSYSFFIMYAIVDSWNPQSMNLELRTKNVLDRWVISRLNQTIRDVTKNLKDYNAFKAAEYAENFVINDLSNWYVRRIRDRVGRGATDGEDKNDAYQTLWMVLVDLSRLLSPFIPFMTDEIFTNLTGKESVTLEGWPVFSESLIDQNLEYSMNNSIKLASVVHAFRKMSNIKVRLPFKKLQYKGPEELTDEIKKVILAEVNVYELEYTGTSTEYEVSGDTSGSNLDLLAGQARDIVRMIQEERKKLGTRPEEKIEVVLKEWPAEFEDYIKRKALVEFIVKGENFSIKLHTSSNK